MSGPVNSPMGNTSPVNVPETPKPEEREESDFSKLGNHDKFPQVNEYIEQRKEFYRRSLPDKNASKLKRIEEWDKAVAIIGELEMLQRTIYNQTVKK